MKIEIAGVEVEKNIEGQHHQMGIKNPRVIVDFMVNRLYTDKIKAITQEISCNARDAHREAGIPDQPIEITIPNSFTPYFMVKDFGIGMNLERLTNVYKFIGESTKRDDNGQTGGFGIGAKCPWAYSDVFTTETVAWENGKKYKRVLVLHRTPENDISFDVISCEETNEPTGTWVKVPVKEQDYSKFRDQIVRATQFWDVKPIIKGAKVGEDFSWNAPIVYISGNGWAILENSGLREKYVVNCDGIPYPIEKERLVEICKDNYYILSRALDYTNKTLVIDANTGDINVALNRESLEYSTKTNEHIKKYFDDCISNMKDFILKDIASQKSLVEATKTYHNHYSTFSNLIPDVLNWASPTGEVTTINPSNYIAIKGTIFSYFLTWKGRLKRQRGSTIHFNMPLVICENAQNNSTIQEPKRAQILGMLDAINGGKPETSVQVIVYYDNTHTNTVNILKQNTLTTVESYPKRKPTPRPKVKNVTTGTTSNNTSMALCWEIVDTSVIATIYSGQTKWSDLSGTPYVIKDTANQFKLSNKHTTTIDRYYTYNLSKRLGYNKVVAIREKDEETAVKNGLVNLYDCLIQTITKEDSRIDLCEEDNKFINGKKSEGFIPLMQTEIFTKIFKNEKHLVHKFVKMFNEAKKVYKNMTEKRNWNYYLLPSDIKRVEMLNDKAKTVTFGLNTIYKRLVKQYPMLSINPRLFGSSYVDYQMRVLPQTMSQAAQYVNMVDWMNKK